MEITKRIAINTAIDKEAVEKVIDHSLKSLIEKSRNMSSLEITGWGTFYLKEKRIPHYIEKFEKKIEKLKVHLKELSAPHAISQLEGKIEWMEEELKRIKKRYGME